MRTFCIAASYTGIAASFTLGGAAAAQCLPSVTCTIVPPTSTFDRFGRAIATFGTGQPFLIGAPHDWSPIGPGMSFVYSSGCQPVPYPTAAPVAATAAFGSSVACTTVSSVVGSPRLAVVGAPAFAGTGAAFVRQEAAGWAALPLLQPAPQEPGDHFGDSVAALPGDAVHPPRAFVAEPASSVPVFGSGAIHAYDATTGALMWSTLNPIPQPNAAFGISLATRIASGRCPDLVAVGAPLLDNASGVDAGSVFLFDATNGMQVGGPIVSPSGPGSHFGTAVAFVEDMLAVGAPGAIGEIGAVYLFVLDPGCGSAQLRGTLVNPAPMSAGDDFGFCISQGPCPDTVAVGAPLEDAPLSEAGVVHLFRLSTGAFLGTVPNPMPAVADKFGLAIASNGETLAVGAPRHDNGSAFDSGAVFMIGLNADCNGNCIEDNCEIAAGTSLDINCDGIPDECQAICHADIAPACGDGQVNGADLGVVIGSWGPGSGPADINRDGIVNGADLGIIIGCWGPCTGSCP